MTIEQRGGCVHIAADQRELAGHCGALVEKTACVYDIEQVNVLITVCAPFFFCFGTTHNFRFSLNAFKLLAAPADHVLDSATDDAQHFVVAVHGAGVRLMMWQIPYYIASKIRQYQIAQAGRYK